MIINETPIRTSENYKINNIDINTEMPKRVEKFNGMTISKDVENFEISEKILNGNLKYGNGKKLEKQNYENGNQNLKIECVKKGTLQIEFNLNEDDINLLENIEIYAENKSTIIIKYLSEEDIEAYHNGIIKIFAKQNSEINVIIVNMLNKNSNNFLSIENELEYGSNVNYTIVDFGGKNSITNFYSNIKGKKAKSAINTVYLGTEDQLFDINYIVELFGEESETVMNVQGALKDNAKKNFKGTIDFKKGCKKAKGDEKEFCMLLSDKAKSKALPMLLCTEEDVEGNHASSAGKVDEDILFYIMSRGISEKDAMKLIVKTKFNEILEKIQDKELQQYIIDEIDKKLD